MGRAEEEVSVAAARADGRLPREVAGLPAEGTECRLGAADQWLISWRRPGDSCRRGQNCVSLAGERQVVVAASGVWSRIAFDGQGA